MSMFEFPFGGLFNNSQTTCIDRNNVIGNDELNEFLKWFFSGKDNTSDENSSESPAKNENDEPLDKDDTNEIRIEPNANLHELGEIRIEPQETVIEQHKTNPTNTILDILGYKMPKKELKNPFVFIANNLTFSIKTKYPIIWDTSTISTPAEDCIFIAVDENKTYPKIDLRGAAKIAHSINCNEEIQKEISQYFDGTEWEKVYCVPHQMVVNGNVRLGFMFAVTND